MASIVVEPESPDLSSMLTEDREGQEGREEEEGDYEEETEEDERTSEARLAEEEDMDALAPTILKKETSPYITIFLGTNFIGILLWATIKQTAFPWFIYVSCPVAIIECFIYGITKRMYFFITVSTYCNITILLFMTYLAYGGAYPWFIFPAFTLAIFPIMHYLFIHCRDKRIRYFMIHISMYTLANVQIFFAWVIHSKNNPIPWFIYPWGGWALLLMVHYNYVLMKNKNMLFLYMFLDAAGIVTITFRFTFGPIILLVILAGLVILLFFQLCLRNRIRQKIVRKRLRARENRLAELHQQLQLQEQLQQQQMPPQQNPPQQLQPQPDQLQQVQQHGEFSPNSSSTGSPASLSSPSTSPPIGISVQPRRRYYTTGEPPQPAQVIPIPPFLLPQQFQFQPPPNIPPPSHFAVPPSIPPAVFPHSLPQPRSQTPPPVHIQPFFQTARFVYPTTAPPTNQPLYPSIPIPSANIYPSQNISFPSFTPTPTLTQTQSSNPISAPPPITTLTTVPSQSALPQPTTAPTAVLDTLPTITSKRQAHVPLTGSPQLKPRRKKLRQPTQPDTDESSSNETKEESDDDKGLIEKSPKEDDLKSSDNVPSSHNDSDDDDLVVVEGESSLDDF